MASEHLSCMRCSAPRGGAPLRMFKITVIRPRNDCFAFRGHLCEPCEKKLSEMALRAGKLGSQVDFPYAPHEVPERDIRDATPPT